MSASFPDKLKEKVLGINRQEKFTLITQKDLYEKKANILHKKDMLLDDDINFVIQEHQQGENCIIIRNTVKHATALFKKLKEKGVETMLYHS